jgi:transposase
MRRPQSHAEREQAWRRHFAGQRAGGLTIRDYCRRHGLKEPSFYSWRRIIGERDRQAAATAPHPPAAPAFLPVAVVDAPARPHDPPIEIRLAGGQHVRVRAGCDRALLADVLAILRTAPKPEARPC